ncbi:RNA-guided pseudouridylation complex pseudouridine synthase subunit Cbf5 [Candidatus Woesearchaeota archaeon]|nr:RNA-guided pseudouridylation complex pseudouridine synthase subunit Cbf5 [Candidatus Woesearchaeota archaeon]
MTQKEVYKSRNKNVKVSRHNITETDSDSANQEPNILLPFEKIKRELLIKRKAETTNKFGCDPDKRPIKELLNYGIINIDKSAGPTSHQVSAYVQQILKIDKSGHSGTLDPLVTGVLPTAIGRATRVVQMLLTAGKEYIAIMHLHKPVSEPEIRKVCEEFVGKIMQLPPVKSSVKREIRERNIYYLEILEIDGQDVLFKTGTQAGTYIRKLIHDIGQKLNVGAQMQELRRTKAGCFDESTLVTLHDLKDALWYYENEGNEKYLRNVIKPVEFAIQHIPKVFVLDSAVEPLSHGSFLAIPGIAKLESKINPNEVYNDKVAVLTLKGELVGLGTAKMSSEEIMKKDHGIAVKMEKIFMIPGTYPRVEIVK